MSTAPGSWPSPISAAHVYRSRVTRTRPATDGEDLYWLEARPEDEGRQTLVRRRAGVVTDVSLPGHDVRTRLHEYGGGDYAVRDGIVLYSDFATQRVWLLEGGREPRPITPESGARVRFGAYAIDPVRRVAYCVREDQRDASVEPVTSLVRLALDDPDGPDGPDDLGTVLVAGRERPAGLATASGDEPADADSPPDFVLDPALSPDGTRLAWLSWNHPHMPWEAAWVRVADLDEAGPPSDVRIVAGGEDHAAGPPQWLDDDRLVLTSDATGFANPYVASLADGSLTPLITEEHEHGGPPWIAHSRTLVVLPGGRVASVRTVEARQGLVVIDPSTGTSRDVGADVTSLVGLAALDEHHVVAQAGDSGSAGFLDRPATVVSIDLRDGTTLPLTSQDVHDPAWVSIPQPVWWDAPDGGRTHGFLYPPTNPDVVRDDRLPPLLVELHGGPTGMATPGYTPARTFWTSRGFAVLDVNYGGSAGFGVAYRERLTGRWGITDVADAVSGVRQLADAGLIDPDRTAIRGGSAGGFSVLGALTTSDVFRAGASYFGISDLTVLAVDTHKFESRYLHGLIAPWPEQQDVYAERSPLTHADRLRVPLILFQGSDDRVVPPAQARLLADVLARQGIDHELVVYEGEGHGFRDPAVSIDALERELAFYQRVFGLTV